MRFTASVFLGLALILWGSEAWGQTQTQMSEKEKEAWDYFYLEEVLQRSCDDPTLRSAIALPQPKLTLETSAEGATMVKAHVGAEVQKKLVFDLTVTSPINSSGETTLADLNGLSTGSTAKLGFSYFGVPWRSRAYKEALGAAYNATTDMVDKTRRILDSGKAPEEKLLEIKNIVANPDDDKKMLDEIQRIAGTADSNDAQKTQSAIDEIKKIIPDKQPTKGWHVTDYLNPVISRPSAVAMLGQQKRDEILGVWQSKMDHAVWVSNLDVNAEQKEFQGADASSTPQSALAKESHTNFKLTASEGVYFKGRIYASLNYSRGTEFTAAQTAGLPPTSQRAEALEFEIRSLFRSFGVAAHLTRDLQANVTSIEIPLYFLQKMGTSDMEFNGGVTLKCRSDNRKCSLSAFIGPALSTVLRMPGTAQ